MAKTLKSFTFDADNKAEFKASSSAERAFYRQLKKVAKSSAHIIDAHVDGLTIKDVNKMISDLDKYSKIIEPWAVRQSAKLLEKLDKANYRQYKSAAKKNANAMSLALKTNVARSDTGATAAALLLEQVGLIQSIPLEAGARAQKIAYENFLNGQRAKVDPSVVDDLMKQMGMTEEVAINRAKLIARTETARANASFVQARAAAIGVTHYIWRTTMDGAERKSHAKMNGKIIAYANPPTLSDGMTGHAGTFPNCRCYQEPVLPKD
jgi:SPP1 gp7 family putative phage head morphogenesis protein